MSKEPFPVNDDNNNNNKFCTFSDMTIAQIEAENTQLTNDLYRLLKKYSGLRNLIRALKASSNIIVVTSRPGDGGGGDDDDDQSMLHKLMISYSSG